MMRTSQMAVACVAVLVLGLVSSMTNRAEAGLIAYYDRLAFNAATTGNQTIDFESGSGVDFMFMDSSFTRSGVTFTSDVNRMFILRNNYYAPALASDYLNLNASGVHYIEIAAGPGTTAIGADFGTLNGTFPTSLQMTVAVTDGSGTSTYNLAAPTQPGLSFIGFTSDNSITNVRFTGEMIVLDNVTTGTASLAVVPEPSSLAVFAIGACVAGLGAARRRRREKQQVAITA